ncbi:sulfurtransferase complex subunit TusC [Vibrio sp. TH_r3]|uniref:sulfurtransferase complex subunit TusC n=1 Tax=Vibrio sp. TH_r3 TaxID=3082084 RepID=UPI0029557B52|nr:sulfurtransferase complex subunit TusC [Vibrio sp. TH_r3]MDV7105429.1 sulfurtransferase complex subunit TusC [Vibrio sp. TH_r3]
MKKLGFIFRSHPHSSAKGREGLDALLAASAYCDNISVFFIGEGVTQLIANQKTSGIYSRDYVPAFKLMDLYDIEEVYLCEDSLIEQGLRNSELVFDIIPLPIEQLKEKLNSCDKLLTF